MMTQEDRRTIIGLGMMALMMVADASPESFGGAGPIDTLPMEEIIMAGELEAVANPVPSMMARVIPEGIPATTLGAPAAEDVFVTAADDIVGMNASQIAERLTIPSSPNGFTVMKFQTPQSGVASPILRDNPGFIGRGMTAGGAREFVIPNQIIPPGTVIETVR